MNVIQFPDKKPKSNRIPHGVFDVGGIWIVWYQDPGFVRKWLFKFMFCVIYKEIDEQKYKEMFS